MSAFSVDLWFREGKGVTDLLNHLLAGNVLVKEHCCPVIADDHPAPGIEIISHLPEALFRGLNVNCPRILMVYDIA